MPHVFFCHFVVCSVFVYLCTCIFVFACLTYGNIICDILVSMLHQNEGVIGKSIPDAREISRDTRDFPRAKPEGNLIINSSTGMDQEIHPSGKARIDSVKTNPSLLRMRE